MRCTWCGSDALAYVCDCRTMHCACFKDPYCRYNDQDSHGRSAEVWEYFTNRTEVELHSVAKP